MKRILKQIPIISLLVLITGAIVFAQESNIFSHYDGSRSSEFDFILSDIADIEKDARTAVLSGNALASTALSEISELNALIHAAADSRDSESAEQIMTYVRVRAAEIKAELEKQQRQHRISRSIYSAVSMIMIIMLMTLIAYTAYANFQKNQRKGMLE